MKHLLVILGLAMTCCVSSKNTPTPKATEVVPELSWQYYFGSIPSQPADDPIVADAQKRAVTVITAMGACSGGIGAEGIVLTTSHCLPNDKLDIFVNGYKARVLYNNKERDLLFLRIYTGEFKPLDFAEPKVDMEVFGVFTQNEYRSVVKRGRITSVEEYSFSTDIILIPGASGGFVYSKDGKLVGVVQMWGALMSHCISGTRVRQTIFENQMREAQ